MSRPIGSKNKNSDETKDALKNVIGELKVKITSLESDHKQCQEAYMTENIDRQNAESRCIELHKENREIEIEMNSLKFRIDDLESEIALSETMLEKREDSIEKLQKAVKLLMVACGSLFIISISIWFLS